MLLAFEGTGTQVWGGTSSWGVNDWTDSTSFVWKFYQLSTAPAGIKKYFPGPNIQGSNCDDILNQAKDFYREVKRTYGSDAVNKLKISLVGYSRGAYMAMCFAKFLQINGVPVHFLGLFDAVSRDMSVEAIISTYDIPTNVATCYHAARSPIIGSRSITMNQIGFNWENGKKLETRKEFPGSHAAMGGFPNDAGALDAPYPEQGDPNRRGCFDPKKEFTAWWEAGRYISIPAVKKGVIKHDLVGASKPKQWIPESEWYKPIPNYKSYQDYQKKEYITQKW